LIAFRFFSFTIILVCLGGIDRMKRSLVLITFGFPIDGIQKEKL
jgi:hypothetical protein